MEEKNTQQEVKDYSVQIKARRKIFLRVSAVAIGLFAVSSICSFIPILQSGIYLWYVAAGISAIVSIVFLVWGIIKIKEGGADLAGFAMIFFVAALLVGWGTCFVNLAHI